MREQLIQYVDLLFAGAENAQDIKQEILQNTLDRYDDLMAQGKTPQAAYQLAISGIGDIREILENQPESKANVLQNTILQKEQTADKTGERSEQNWTKAIAIAFFILSAIPVLILQNTIGLCLCLLLVAAGVVLLIVFGKQSNLTPNEHKRSPLNRGLIGAILGIAVCLYLLISFATKAWQITWLIYPIAFCLCGIVNGFFDLGKSTASAVVRIIVFGLLTVTLFICMLGLTFASVKNNWTIDRSEVYQETGGSVAAAEVQQIDLAWVSGDITFETYEGSEIIFNETFYGTNCLPMVWRHNNGKLTILFNEPNIGIQFFQSIGGSKSLKVQIPSNWVGKDLNIENVSSSVEMTGLVCDEIDLSNVSGDCELLDCSANSVEFETVSGNLTYSGRLLDLDLDTVSADCDIALNNEPRQIDLNSVSGDSILYLPESCGFTVELESVSGDISCVYPLTSKGGRYTFGNGSCSIDVDTTSGDLIIRPAA